MIVLRKKRMIIYSLLVIFISVATLESSEHKRTTDAKLVNSENIDEKVVIIDAGHGRRRWWCSS